MSDKGFTNPNSRSSVGKVLTVVALSAVAAFLAVELLRCPAPAEAQITSSRGDATIFAVAGKISPESYGLYLIDRRRGTITVYEWLHGKPGKLKLAAARNCTFDLLLDEYNTEPPPSEIKSLVRQGQSLSGYPER